MVNQHWMVILEEEVVITSLPQRWERPKHDPFDLFDRIVNSFSRKPICKVQDLVTVIVDQCCGAFDRHAPSNEYQFFAMFEASIGKVAMTERELFNRLREASNKAALWLQIHQKLNHSPDFVDKFLDYSPETSLLYEVKDIRDEIGMIRAVLDHQRLLLPNLGAQMHELYDTRAIAPQENWFNDKTDKPDKEVAFPEQDRVINTYIEDLSRMDRQVA
ncbi:hypothetical protein BDW74DRAFT_53006 [Aspergillus multicolor]|uniref:uncharacterized protein n=1 Tax=Aspergillus multicolor TaxID=41759 RepID=UPI003CCD3D81